MPSHLGRRSECPVHGHDHGPTWLDVELTERSSACPSRSEFCWMMREITQSHTWTCSYLCLCGNVGATQSDDCTEVKEPPSPCAADCVPPVGGASEHVGTYH